MCNYKWYFLVNYCSISHLDVESGFIPDRIEIKFNTAGMMTVMVTTVFFYSTWRRMRHWNRSFLSCLALSYALLFLYLSVSFSIVPMCSIYIPSWFLSLASLLCCTRCSAHRERHWTFFSFSLYQFRLYFINLVRFRFLSLLSLAVVADRLEAH